jgi:hypothetical protein
MPARSPIRWAVMVALLGSTRAGEALANVPVPVVRFEYHAGPECPRELDFVANLRGKAAFDVDGSGERASRTFTVTLSKRPDARPSSYRGELLLRTPSGAPSIREVTGVNCIEVAEAIAVVIAIELSPEQREPAKPAPHASPEGTKSMSSPPRWQWAGAAGGGFTGALADRVSAEARLSFVLRRNATALLSPEFRAGFVYADGRRVENEAGVIELRLFGVTFEGCPMRARLWQRLSLEPCAKVLLAVRAATGGPPSNPTAESNTGSWIDIGGLLRALYDISDTAWIEISAEGFAPLVRDRFHTFAPGIAVFGVPGAGARGAFGLGIHFE